MNEKKIREAVARLESIKVADEEAAWDELRPLKELVLPYLREAYHKMRSWRGRVSCVYHSIRYARTSNEAFQLGIDGTKDRSSIVRYRACSLLAYSLKDEAIPYLQELLDHTDEKTRKDAEAAIDAIKNRNHHLFIDRDHTGRTYWSVNKGDSPALKANQAEHSTE